MSKSHWYDYYKLHTTATQNMVHSMSLNPSNVLEICWKHRRFQVQKYQSRLGILTRFPKGSPGKGKQNPP